MFLKVHTDKRTGVTRLYLAESYWKNGTTRQKHIESLGRLDELKKQYDDPIAHFKKVAEERNNQHAESTKRSIEIDMSEELAEEEDSARNVGYGVLKQVYKDLKLDKFWQITQRKYKMQYSMDQIFRLLVFARALYPGSKKYTYDNRHKFFEKFDGFSLDDVYSSLDVIHENSQALQKWIYDQSVLITERDLSVSYFDCTNYYFDISCPDTDILDKDGTPVDKDGNPTEARYRKRGPEKNHRPDPIVSMGLLMDSNKIPIAYELFPGNESEKLHMRPIIDRVKTEFTSSRIIVVADRGLNTSDNIYFLNGDNKADVNLRDGYVYGQSVRGADAEFKTWLLSGGYTTDIVTDEDGNEITFRHKSRIFPKELHVNLTVPGQKQKKKKTVSVDQKQMVYYSAKYAKRQKANRDAMIERARDLIAHPKKYDRVAAAGSASYIRNIAFDKQTGEIIDGRELLLDEERIAEEEKYDGYYSIVTSELGMSDLELRDIYRGLTEIENSFKITKSDLEGRPVYVWTNPHIDGHFATCYTVLVLARIIQAKTGNKYPVGRILESLRSYKVIELDSKTWQFTYHDNVIAECDKAFHMGLKRKYRTQLEMRRLLRY